MFVALTVHQLGVGRDADAQWEELAQQLRTESWLHIVCLLCLVAHCLLI